MIYSNDPLPSFPGRGGSTEGMSGGVEYATWGVRVAGSIIDGLLVATAAILVATVVGLHPLAITYIGHGAKRHGQLKHILQLALMVNVGNLVYSCWLLSSKWRATVGMRVARIRIEDTNGQPASFGRIAGRMGIVVAASMLSLIIPIVAIAVLADWLWPLWDKQNQTLHDKLVGTVVVRGTAT